MAYTTQVCGIPIREWKSDLSDSLYEQARVLSICHRPRCREVAAIDKLEIVAEILLDIQPVTCHVDRSPIRRKAKDGRSIKSSPLFSRCISKGA